MLDANQLYQKLLSFLESEDDLLPYLNNSVIAGGAVSNLIYNQKHNKSAPVNDIDIFLFKKREDLQENNLDGAVDNYSSSIQSNNFKLEKTERKGILNITTVLVDYIGSLEDMGKELIEGFDINCVKSFITLEAFPRLFLHGQFHYFLNTRQIKSYGTKTPIKTMLRIVKKEKELEAYLDRNHLKSIYQLSKGMKTFIIEENFVKYENELKELSNYFRFFKMSNGLYKAKCSLPYEKLHRNEKSIMRDPSLRGQMIMVWDLFFSKNKIYRKYEKLRPYTKSLKVFIGCSDFESKLKEDFNESNLISLEKILKKVIGTGTYFKQASVNGAIAKAKHIERYSNQEEIYLGFLGILRFESIEIDIDQEYKRFKDSYLANDKKLAIPYQLSKELMENVVELTTKSSLKEESRKMSHCVHGYSSYVENNQCRIFSIRTESGQSTIEITYHNGKFIGVQHRAFANTFPSSNNREIAFKLIRYLNENIKLSENFAPKVINQMVVDF